MKNVEKYFLIKARSYYTLAILAWNFDKGVGTYGKAERDSSTLSVPRHTV